MNFYFKSGNEYFASYLKSFPKIQLFMEDSVQSINPSHPILFHPVLLHSLVSDPGAGLGLGIPEQWVQPSFRRTILSSKLKDNNKSLPKTDNYKKKKWDESDTIVSYRCVTYIQQQLVKLNKIIELLGAIEISIGKEEPEA